MPNNKQPWYFTRHEVAELWGVNPRTIDRWWRAGKLPAPNVVRTTYRFNKDEIMAHFEASKRKAK